MPKLKTAIVSFFMSSKLLYSCLLKKNFSNISKRIKLKCFCFYLFKRSKYFRSSWTGVIGCRESPRMMTVDIIVIRFKSKTCLIILQIIASIKILENHHWHWLISIITTFFKSLGIFEVSSPSLPRTTWLGDSFRWTYDFLSQIFEVRWPITD